MGKAVINNHPYQFEEAVSILEAARALGVEIPTLCHDDRLKPIGSCRMCLVKVEGKPHPMTACNTSLTDGMVISTNTSALENERRALLKMLAQDHPGEGLTQTPDKPFYRYAGASADDVENDKRYQVEQHNSYFKDRHPKIVNGIKPFAG